MEPEKTFLQYLFGDIDLVALSAYYIWAILGLFLSFYLDFNRTGQSMGNFSLKKFFNENWGRTLFSMAIIFVAMVFHEPLLGLAALTAQSSFLIGLSADKIVESVKARRNAKKYNFPTEDSPIS